MIHQSTVDSKRWIQTLIQKRWPNMPLIMPIILLRVGFPSPLACRGKLDHLITLGECFPGARPARYLFINYPDFSPRVTL